MTATEQTLTGAASPSGASPLTARQLSRALGVGRGHRGTDVRAADLRRVAAC
jgi:hypothetical protein